VRRGGNIKTGESKAILKLPFLQFASTEKLQQRVQRKTEVYGTVVEIEAVSVLCELYMDENQERTVVVKLPKILFPANLRYGTPITLAYREDASGFKKSYRRLMEDKYGLSTAFFDCFIAPFATVSMFYSAGPLANLCIGIIFLILFSLKLNLAIKVRMALRDLYDDSEYQIFWKGSDKYTTDGWTIQDVNNYFSGNDDE
jgi:hypothetical protein